MVASSSRKVSQKKPVKKSVTKSPEESVVEEVEEVVAVQEESKKVSTNSPTKKVASSKSKVSVEKTQDVDVVSTEVVTVSSDTDVEVDAEKSPKENDTLEGAFLSKLSTFVNKVSLINKEVKELQSLGKTLEKEFNAVVKVLSKQKNKSKNNENRTLSGFAMPSLLSDELYDFLNIDKGTLIPRKDVTKLINEYIKKNDLRNEQDKRKILPDDSLKKIFNCTDNDAVTYFNLQTYMKHHFIKDTSKLTPIQVV